MHQRPAPNVPEAFLEHEQISKQDHNRCTEISEVAGVTNTFLVFFFLPFKAVDDGLVHHLEHSSGKHLYIVMVCASMKPRIFWTSSI